MPSQLKLFIKQLLKKRKNKCEIDDFLEISILKQDLSKSMVPN